MKILSPEAIVVGFEPIEWEKFPNLKVVGCNATSTEHLDEECAKRGIKLISLKGETEFLNTVTSTAEMTIGLIIALLRNYKTALNAPYQDRDEYIGHTLSGKTLGIIGYGRVGRQVEKIALALGMKTTHDFRPSLDSDILTLHIPLENNEGMFTKEYFKQMKPTAYLINTSRSGVIENGALLFALENGIIKGAAVDFLDDPQLLEYVQTHPNLILTNHLGGCTVEDRQRTEDFIINKVLNYEAQFKKENH